MFILTTSKIALTQYVSIFDTETGTRYLLYFTIFEKSPGSDYQPESQTALDIESIHGKPVDDIAAMTLHEKEALDFWEQLQHLARSTYQANAVQQFVIQWQMNARTEQESIKHALQSNK